MEDYQNCSVLYCVR